ncbi:hypothetical protein AUEXF2481DRAFT_61873 [Aureobasidium subglaciale EXF-2481]|uniref:Phosphatidate phosphatase APP1 catalytic domain-containing protein n=1 Tax=Aureobasidium subglaciale (strain EXF-2481) TaxID=1043005 RepID=A0A074YZS3_AURSE|nr:uncharacterized protein AUEXF2481DRAFT_61873 [Aureobasidium subglaciale EXF-2481]KAI5195921.1 hypothetical protein E4T38_08790 [Aureobasidium subglaciale]KAI5214879.1 hypothetical protein E4T40_08747 [Aureobasidium subglaciale]KAI5217859.1 hypothetical protein E4T41_08657 [Aureobasidium subglaciale]KAI5255414.1 hypothetical protein E4T46_08691 [Aureobasidium subglaciale]KEQ99622.1 hypothetical protein AUEXF2481DRAFT_61873 [Aureobasidium subglaciale EXF-2481]
MRSSLAYGALLQASLSTVVSASPAPTPRRVFHLESQAPQVTASPVELSPSRTDRLRRGIIDDLKSDVGSVLSGLGSDLPSWVASGVPNFFQGFPTGDAVASSLGLDDSQLDALPTQVLNVDPYANWTESGWNVRFHGNVYKQPNTSTADLNRLANIFLIDTSVEDLPQDQADRARNVTASIFVVQQGDVAVAPIHLDPAPSQGASGQSDGSGAVTPSGGNQTVTLPYNTTVEGDFDVFVPINGAGLMAGNETQQIQRLNTHVEGASIGNSTAYLVPTTGLTVVSDIDDILRVTKIYQPAQGLLNSFAKEYVPWENMPDIYANWSRSLPNTHFHYLTTTPEQVTRAYMNFTYSHYPGGSFDTRPLNFSDVSATLSIRKFLLTKVFETFPERKFILVADTSNSDVMKDYPQMATDYPNQVQCIFLRNTSGTDSGDKFPYDTSGFKNLNQQKYMFFLNPDDLTGLDIANGQCYNQSIAQNLTFGYQGLPFGIGDTPSAVNASANSTGKTGTASGFKSKDAVGAQSSLALVAALGAAMFMFL